MTERKVRRYHLCAKDVMTADPITVRPETAVKDVAALMLTHHISGLPVVSREGELVGIVTEGDLLHKETGRDGKGAGLWATLPRFGKWLEAARKAEGVTAAELMTAPVVTVDADTGLHEVAALMVRRKINRVPVMRGGRLAGIVSRADILRVFVRPDAAIAEAVRDSLLHELWIEVGKLKIDVRQGVVYLEGVVDRRSEKELAERWVAAIDGVLGVESTLTYEFDDWMVPAE